MKRTKTYELANFKALPEEGEGKFQAVVSVFGNVDLQGDRVMPGAFEKTLTTKREKQELIPVIWSHDWLNPDAHIGFVDPKDAVEVLGDKKAKNGPTGGLLVKGTIDVHKPFAKQVFDLLKERRVKEWSFAYDIIDESPGDDKANELNELDLIEVGPCLKGANPETYTVAAKSVMEKELKRAYEIQDPMKEFLDMGVMDPEVSAMLAKTAEFGTHVSEVPKLTVRDVIGEDGAVRFLTGDFPKKASEDTVDLEEPDVSEIAAEAYEAGMKAAQAKPWHIEKRGEQYCVIKDSDSSTVSCHDTQEDAEAHVRALYANESTADADDEKAVTVTTDSNTSTGHVDLNITVDGEKIGRTIGAKAASSLKTRIADAIDEFVAEINGQIEDPAPEEKTDEPDGEKQESPTEFLNRLLGEEN